MAEAVPHPATLDLQVPVIVRQATRDDVYRLEWDGQFTQFRNLFRRAYKEQQNGRRLMLVADYNGYPIGRLFVLFTSSDNFIANGSTRAYLYSFYIMTPFRGLGIGSHMVRYAEAVLIERGFQFATIAVAKQNSGALRLYERLHYTHVREDPGRWSYTDHIGRTHRVQEPCWILEKALQNP
jgi:ribosomal protein S18 acetylase RimI-like enzyme